LNIPTLPSLVGQHLHVIWAYGNKFKEDVTLQPHNTVAFYTPEFHNPQQMNRILLDCNVEGTPDGETHRRPLQVIWVRVGENTDDGLRGGPPDISRSILHLFTTDQDLAVKWDDWEDWRPAVAAAPSFPFIPSSLG
jgi:hypothetical protein